jgi:hypothetical protein|tara:strand:+ start:681 stop:989 length:309 start_codon:yes stop_codon:yes gene_type:complete
MAILYTWTIPQVERTVSDGGIQTIHWCCTGVDGDYSCRSYGTTSHTPNASAVGFIAYNSVTEANCIAWAQGALDKAAVEANIKVDVDNQKAPTTASGQPWAA